MVDLMDPPAFHDDVRGRGEPIDHEEEDDVEVTLRPAHAKSFQRPESTKGRQQRSDDQLQEASWNPGDEALQRKSAGSDHHHRRRGSDDRKAKLAGREAERNDDQRDLEALEQHSLEGEDERHPVHAARRDVLLLHRLLTHAGQAPSRDARDALSVPLQAEQQKQRADDHAQRSNRNRRQRHVQHGDGHGQHGETSGGPDQS